MQPLGLLLVLVFLTAGCCGVPGTRWVRSEVFFGLSRPEGGAVTAADWQLFLDEVVTPRFPEGLSIVEVSGQWRNLRGDIDREPSKMLILLHRPNAAINARVDEIRAEYRRRFNQEAVMKVTSRARVEF